ncbi:hypothetical protein EUTSA_v10001168mg [Eutrema salsugineum]|uniref:MADS-box domain-containing protein n=1 Tax=Eutrema salsugineum TaxID=72664 RepID=V4KPE9_EUTSA|nr:agamous-like MADS-box protein AGL29 [Eutrema salsugineum]ESQ39780.1 hypothetical protein EUTSA_v10001168mg [Eutrema salsugineum]
MGFRKIKINYIEKSLTRRMIISKCRAGIFNKANALARLHNVEVAVFINSPAGRQYLFRSPGFNSYSRKSGRSSASLKKARILKLQAKLVGVMKKLEAEKQREKVLKKRFEETLQKYNMKEIENSSLEELIAFKEKLETLRKTVNQKRMEMEVSLSY